MGYFGLFCVIGRLFIVTAYGFCAGGGVVIAMAYKLCAMGGGVYRSSHFACCSGKPIYCKGRKRTIGVGTGGGLGEWGERCKMKGEGGLV